MRLPHVLCAVLLVSAAGSVSAAETGNNGLFAHIRAAAGGISTVRMDFIQRKKLNSPACELIIRGSAALERNRAVWRVAQPIPCVALIEGNKLRQWDADSGRTIEIASADSRTFATFAAGMQAFRDADPRQLEQHFKVDFPEPLTFRLVPRDSIPLSKFIKSFVFTVAPDYSCVVNLVITEINGDVTSVQFKNYIINKPIPAAAWKVGQ